MDFGCGAGFDLLVASRLVGTSGLVCGVDLTKDMIDRTVSHLNDAGITNYGARQIDSEDIPCPDNFFDYVVAPGVAGFYSVQLAGMVAPSAKKAAELTIAALWTAIYGFVAVLALIMGTWPIALATIPAVIGSGKAVVDDLA